MQVDGIPHGREEGGGGGRLGKDGGRGRGEEVHLEEECDSGERQGGPGTKGTHSVGTGMVGSGKDSDSEHTGDLAKDTQTLRAALQQREEEVAALSLVSDGMARLVCLCRGLLSL